MVPNPVSQDHLLGFGAIIHEYARFERLIEIVVSVLMNSEVGPVGIVMSGLGYRGKIDVLNSFLLLTSLPANHKTVFADVLKRLDAHNALRNLIAHYDWVPGERPESIRPLSITARGGKAKVRGVEDGEPDYTASELMAIAHEVSGLYRELCDHLFAIGMLGRRAV
jgi:hypothetical protein